MGCEVRLQDPQEGESENQITDTCVLPIKLLNFIGMLWVMVIVFLKRMVPGVCFKDSLVAA